MGTQTSLRGVTRLDDTKRQRSNQVVEEATAVASMKGGENIGKPLNANLRLKYCFM